MDVSMLDWVVLKEDIEVNWSGATYSIKKGTVCRVMRVNTDGTLNVGFGIKGIHKVDVSLLEPKC